MSDIVERLQDVAAIIQKEHGRVAGASCLTTEAADLITSLRAELERKDEALEAWNSAVRVDVLMEGARYMGVEPSRGRQAWELTRAALSAQKEEEA